MHSMILLSKGIPRGPEKANLISLNNKEKNGDTINNLPLANIVIGNEIV